MKQLLIKFNFIMLFTLLSVGITSCTRDNSETNTQKDAENRNDQKFNNADETDAKFIVDAYAAGMKEIRVSERVKDQLATADARSLATMMISEHTAINNKLRALAASKQISLPTDLTTGEENDINDLAKKSGNDLDKAYTNALISDHEDAVKLFDKASSNALDAEIRDLFEDNLPKIRMHLEMAKTTRDKLNAS